MSNLSSSPPLIRDTLSEKPFFIRSSELGGREPLRKACHTYRCDPAKKTDTCWAKTYSQLYLIRSLKKVLRFIVYEGITEPRWVKPIIKTYREWKSPGHARAVQVWMFRRIVTGWSPSPQVRSCFREMLFILSVMESLSRLLIHALLNAYTHVAVCCTTPTPAWQLLDWCVCVYLCV